MAPSDRNRKLDLSYLLNDKSVTPRIPGSGDNGGASGRGSGLGGAAPPNLSLGASSAAPHQSGRGTAGRGATGRGSSTATSSFANSSATDQQIRRNTCTICGHCFAQPADLRKHVRTVHEGLRPFRCETCHKCFGEKGNLRKHMRSVHLNERPFRCSLCDSTFAFKDGLARHIKLVHENVRPYVCSRCGSSYKQVSQLRRHSASCGGASSSRKS